MSTRPPLTTAEKERVYHDKLRGQTLPAIATTLHCSVACARKWWRYARDYGGHTLRLPRRGRGATGAGTRSDPRVVACAVQLKQAHPGWGPNRVRLELQQDRALAELPLPSRTTLAAVFHERCPACLAPQRPKAPGRPKAPAVTSVHECWQLDSQEGVQLGDGQVATICSIRDPLGAAILLSRAVVTTTAVHWRKLSMAEVRTILRAAFTAWQTLPSRVQTDNELCLGGSPTDPYPSILTLWLRGLGVEHTFIRPGQPTDQAQIERNHRTLANWVADPLSLSDLPHLQAALDRERTQHNQWLPSRASDCAGRAPLVAHPELLQPRRPYRPEAEVALFDLQQVYDYLATIPLQRKVNTTGQISLGRQLYSVGRRYAGQTVTVRCDPQHREWVVCTDSEGEVARRVPKALDIPTLTGLAVPVEPLAVPIQLTLPFVA